MALNLWVKMRKRGNMNTEPGTFSLALQIKRNGQQNTQAGLQFIYQGVGDNSNTLFSITN